MYYKSLIQDIKDGINKQLRCEIIEETIIEDKYFFKIYLKPDDVLICPQCHSHDIMLFGKKTRNFVDEYYTDSKAYITLVYHRFKCKYCSKMFCDSVPVLNAKETIPMTLKLNVIEDLKHDSSFTFIANRRNVSVQTVINIFETYIHYERVPFGDVICMDEFKNLKHSNGKYAFVMYDPNAHLINDILPNRIQSTIDDYLYTIDWKEKEKVKYVVTDMNESYRTLIQKHFRNATHIIDCFHYLRYIEDAFNDVRIRIQGLYDSTSPEYKILKRNWRILSSYEIKVDDGKTYYNHIQKRNTSIETVIDDAVNINPELQKAYTLTQSFLKGCREVKFETAESWLDSWLKELIDCGLKEFYELRDMFFNWKKEILNSFIRFGDKRLHNGHIEGINNRIKVIKRVSFGYGNFTHFRNRIMHIINKNTIIKLVDKSQIIRKKRKK